MESAHDSEETMPGGEKEIKHGGKQGPTASFSPNLADLDLKQGPTASFSPDLADLDLKQGPTASFSPDLVDLDDKS